MDNSLKTEGPNTEIHNISATQNALINKFERTKTAVKLAERMEIKKFLEEEDEFEETDPKLTSNMTEEDQRKQI